MATSWNKIDLRKADWRDFSDPSISEKLIKLKNAHYDPWIFEFLLRDVEVVDGAAHEIRVDFTVDFDNGETTPVVLLIKGAHAQDKATGTGAQAVTIYGFGIDGVPQKEEVTMHGTAATEIPSTKFWTRYVGSQVTQVGTGGTNAGIIQITNPGQGEVYGTIDTGEWSTIGARVYVPENYNGFLSMKGSIVAANNATAVLEAFDGVIVAPVYSASALQAAIDSYYVPVGSTGMIDLGIVTTIIVGADTYYITFTQATKSDDSNQTIAYHIKVIIFGTENVARGLPA
ncbi:hypothetical protein LCGC14_0889210 [marine sediment metagenome]|uniref:Uncharacterized protein n=1 Tax=marine sediment metagenome TaxID=412755 RepID=A0A0F9NZT2_9ZZZZ|nr:hypothetical protein [bacterium]